jgi:peroxiredoxin
MLPMPDAERPDPERPDLNRGPAADTAAVPSATGDEIGLDRFVRRVPVVICFAGTVTSPVTQEVIRGFDEQLADFGRARVQALVVVPDERSVVGRVRRQVPGNTPVLADEDGAWRERFGVLVEEKAVTTVLLGLDGTVADVMEGAAGGVHAEEALELVSLSSLDDGSRS